MTSIEEIDISGVQLKIFRLELKNRKQYSVPVQTEYKKSAILEPWRNPHLREALKMTCGYDFCEFKFKRPVDTEV